MQQFNANHVFLQIPTTATGPKYVDNARGKLSGSLKKSTLKSADSSRRLRDLRTDASSLAREACGVQKVRTRSYLTWAKHECL
jgi:hypothetical protein